MASSEGISDDTLKQLLSLVSRWYDKRKYISMLKVLYTDHVTAYHLDAAIETIDLLNLLISSGDLSPTDLTILYDTMKATKQFGLEKEIKNLIPSCPNVRDIVISKFTPHRQKLIKLGMSLRQVDVAKISELYNNPVMRYEDSCSLIMDLEHRRIIREGKMETVIQKLDTLQLSLAVESLTEDIPSESSFGHGHCEVDLKFNNRKRKSQDAESEYEPSKKDPLMSIKDTVANIGKLKTEDIPEFFKEYKCIPNYFVNIGLTIDGLSSRSIIFHLSVSDPNALENLWEITLSGELIHDLAKVLVPADLQEEFIERWSTELDEKEYQAALNKLRARVQCDSYYDFCIISENAEWENKLIKDLKHKRPNLKCIIMKNWRLSKPKTINHAIGLSSKIIIGFSPKALTEYSKYAAHSVILEMMEAKTLDDAKLIPVRISEDAVLPPEFKSFTVDNAWEEEFVGKLLQVLCVEDIKCISQKEASGGELITINKSEMSSDGAISNIIDASTVEQEVFVTLCKLKHCPLIYWPTVGWCKDFANKMHELATWYTKEGDLQKGLENVDVAIGFIDFQRRRSVYGRIGYNILRKCVLLRCEILLRHKEYNECIRTCEIQIGHPDETQQSYFRVYLARSLLRLDQYDECVQELKLLNPRFYRENEDIQEIIQQLKTKHVDTSEFEREDDVDEVWIPPGHQKYGQPRTNASKTAKKRSRSRRAGKTRRVAIPSSPLTSKLAVGGYMSSNPVKSRPKARPLSVHSTHALNDVEPQLMTVGSRKETNLKSKAKNVMLSDERQKEAKQKKVATGGKSHLAMTSKMPPQKKSKLCRYCNKTLYTTVDVELHVNSMQHRVKVNSDSDRKWSQRNPPMNVINGKYMMCERPICERGVSCTCAHSQDELKEWRERYNYRIRKIREAIEDKLYSFMDEITYNYNFDNSLLKDDIDGVECNITVDKKVDVTKRIDNKFTSIFEYHLKCTGKKYLKRVGLLHDEHRDNFYFTQPLEEDKPQICPGKILVGDDFMTYSVSVQFVSSNPGHFDQWVIFDLGERQYMKREISVHVGLQEVVGIPMNIGSINPNPFALTNVIPFEEKPEFQQELLQNAKQFKPKTADEELLKEKLLKEKLSKNNYKMMMHMLIDIEEREQNKLIGMFNLKTTIVISDRIQTDSTGAPNLEIAQGGELFGKINLQKTLDFDSLAGILILESVNSVACRFSSHPNMAFEAKIYNDGKCDGRTEDTVYVLFNKICVTKINLKDGSKHDAEIKFLLDRIPFGEMHFAIRSLQEMHCVWPRLAPAKKSSTELDEHQETAASFIWLNAIQIICGPFGTGKTRVLATSVKRILEQPDNSRILICTLSNSAADLFITDGLKEESGRFIKANNAYKILRVYQPNRRVSTIPKGVKKHCLLENESKLRVPMRDDIEKAKVVICTLATAIYMIPLKVKGLFTHILIDEAGQALEPQTIMPLVLADENTRVVLAGDHLQMSPKIYSKLSSKAGFHISLLERLKKMYGEKNSVLLRRNYRTCRPILEFLSETIYMPGIECATRNERVHSDFPAMSLHEVKGFDKKLGPSYINEDESIELAERVQYLYDNWPETFGEKDIAVVTSYHAQVFLIRNLLRKRGLKDIVVEHVRNIQGRQFRVIFISTVRTRKTLNIVEMTAIRGTDFISTHKYGFLSDKKLLNTAFTRAKSMVVVVGDPVALCSAGECCLFWSEYVRRCEAIGGIFPKGLTLDKIMTEMNNTRQRLNPSAKSFEPSGLTSFLSKHIPEHVLTSSQMIAGKRREERLNDTILRELNLDTEQQEQLRDEQNKDSEENQDIQQRTSVKKKKTNWRKLENLIQIREGSDIKYIPSQEEDGLRLSSDDWLDMCKKTPDKYKYCTFSFERTGMFAIDDTGKHICIITATRRGMAFDKDTVIVEVLRNGNTDCNDEMYGVVKQVIKRHSNPCLQVFVCKLDPRTNNLMAPINKDFPKLAILGRSEDTTLKAEIKIYKVTDDHMDEDERLVSTGIEEVSITDRPNALFLVRYLKWYPKYPYPLGCVIKRLPPGDSLDRGLQIIKLEHNVDTHWSESVNKELRENRKFSEKWQIPEAELRDRLDLRKECVFTIDSFDTKDLEDALNVTELPDGHYKVGVHISDVSYFVKKQSEIDLEAKKRCTSYYPTSATPIHMIHERLSSNQCSLKPDKDRLTISVILKIDKDGCAVLDETEFMRSIIKSQRKFSYNDVEKIIHKRSDGPNKNMTKQIRLLNQLAIKRRETRLKSGRFCYNHDDATDDLDCPLAHSLVEEFMLLANEAVAKFLIKSYPKCVPLRRQLPPDQDNMEEWITKFHGPIKNSLDMSAKIIGLSDDTSNMNLTKDVWNKLVGLLKKQQDKGETTTPRSIDEDFLKIVDLVADDMLHPQLMMTKLRYEDIQFESEYICSGRVPEEDERHHSLSVSCYTHFTSPIRRYIDLVVHRLLVAALKRDKQAPYTPEDIEDICNDMNGKTLNAKRFERRTKDLVLALDLKKRGALPYHPVIDRVDDTNVYLAFPQSYISRCQAPLSFKYLKPSERIITDNGTSTVKWKMNVCDARDQSNLQTSVDSRHMSRLDPARFVVEMKSKFWQKLVDAITSGTQTRITLGDCTKDIKIKDELRKDKDGRKLVDTVKYEQFEREFRPFDVMLVHLAPELRDGILQPTIQLVSLAENIDVCLEHRKNPVLCFSQLAAESPRCSETIEQYKKTWLSVLAMCSAYGAVHEDNATIIRNVNILWKQDDSGSFTGSLKLPVEFCESKHLWLFRKPLKKRKEEQIIDTTDLRALNYVCVRYSDLLCPSRPPESKPTHLKGKSTSLWVGHCYTTAVNAIVESVKTYLEVNLKLNQSAIPLPISQIRSREILCTIELIPKSLPDRRTEEAVLTLSPSKTPLTTCIVLQQEILNRVAEKEEGQHLSDDEEEEVLVQRSLNRICQNWKIYSIPDYYNITLPPPNLSQQNAIEKAISQTFTVIQGPPGTGKSVTGSHLAYFFAKINKHVELKSYEENRPQVLYCGPSNKSVEVVAGYLKRLPGIRVVRVYSESIEDKDYPRPWLTKPKRMFTLMKASIDPKNCDIALQYLIRQRGNRFSEKIKLMEEEFMKQIEDNRKAMSRTFKDEGSALTKKQQTQKPTVEEIKEYNTLIMNAKKEELRKYDVILTTCNVAGSSGIRRFCKIMQCIIDEAGMCTEPESLVPLVGCSPHKVVLIGDHKQLRPIVQEPNAKELGMEISLLERYADEAIMLETQYRMHPSICKFPSQRFYDNRLETDKSVLDREQQVQQTEQQMLMWPRDGSNEYRTLFCHVEGREESLTVKTEEGNENSRCNKQEIDCLMKVVLKLVDKRVVARNILVLTQYRLQLSKIKTELKNDSRTCDVRAETVITSQGTESEYVIMSTVRSMPLMQIEKNPTIGWKKKFLGYIIDENQTNVAITRAKRGLILIGNKHLLETHDTWKQLIKSYEARGCLKDDMDFLTTF